MSKQRVNNIKLGIFVLGGLIFLVFLLYMIGKNRNLFGNTYILKARFENVQGLVAGNNVRFSGVQAGTVKKVNILNDTVIEVTMMIETTMKSIIRKNAIVSIGTDGLVGNKVINIIPAKVSFPLAEEGDILPVKKMVNTDEMLQILSTTNNDVAVIAEGLKLTVKRINNSNALWNLLSDNSLPVGLNNAVKDIHNVIAETGNMMNDLHEIVLNIKKGKGSIGMLMKDTSLAKNLDEVVMQIKTVSNQAESLGIELNKMIKGIEEDINNGTGTIHALLKDSMLVKKLNESLGNIQQGTDYFKQNMEALKHNFLLKGYFRKLEKQNK